MRFPFLQTTLRPPHMAVSLVRRPINIAAETGPLGPLEGQRVLVLADAQNLDCSARDHGCKVSWRQLAQRLKSAASRCWLHAVFSRSSDEDNRRWDYFAERGWSPHAKITRWVNRAGARQPDCNADNHLAFVTALLASRLPVDWCVVGSGDGTLCLDLAENLRMLPSSPRIATLSVAGATAQRLDCRLCPDLIQLNIELGRDCLHPLNAATRAAI